MGVARVENRESSVSSYRDLLVWQKAMVLVQAVYDLTKCFPQDERFGLTQQMRRAAVSIPSNIAEGSSRRSTQEFLRYINIASGSLAEMETQIILAEQLSYVNQQNMKLILEGADEVSRMLQGLYNSLQAKITRLPTLDSKY